jgi:Ca-activated chloride channel family protein
VRQVYGQQPVFGQRSAEVTLIDIERDSGLSSLWEVEITPRPAGTYRVAQAELLYDDAATGHQEKLTTDAVLEFTTDRGLVSGGVNTRVQNEIAVARAARSLDKTIMGMRTQQLDVTQAMQDLHRTKTLMLDQGKLLQAQQLTQAIQQIEGGGSVEKTLMGAVYNLDQGKTQ